MAKFAKLLCVLTLAGSTPAMAQSFVSDTTGYQGTDAVLVNFDSPLPSGFSLNGGRVTTGSIAGVQAQPNGSTGNFLSTDIDKGYGAVSFLWGSIDTYNLVEFLDQAGQLVGSLTGSQVALDPANGDWTSDRTNRYVTFTADQSGQLINSVRLNSTGISFEADNFAFINAQAPVPVPEPDMAMLFGPVAALVLWRRRRALRPA